MATTAEEVKLYDNVVQAKYKLAQFLNRKRQIELSQFCVGKVRNPDVFGFPLTQNDTKEEVDTSFDEDNTEAKIIGVQLQTFFSSDANRVDEAKKLNIFIQHLVDNNNVSELKSIQTSSADRWIQTQKLLRSNILAKNTEKLNKRAQNTMMQLHDKETRFITQQQAEQIYRSRIRELNSMSLSKTTEFAQFYSVIADITELNAMIDSAMLPELKIAYVRAMELRNEVDLVNQIL